MSMFYRKEEPYGPYRHEWDEPEYDFEIHEEEYSKKPVTSDKHMPNSHHTECTWDMTNVDTCLCFELYSRDAQADQEKELEEMHAEWWQ